jgi:hypothetical protein
VISSIGLKGKKYTKHLAAISPTLYHRNPPECFPHSGGVFYLKKQIMEMSDQKSQHYILRDPMKMID